MRSIFAFKESQTVKTVAFGSSRSQDVVHQMVSHAEKYTAHGVRSAARLSFYHFGSRISTGAPTATTVSYNKKMQ